LTALQLLPVWAVRYVPTIDGPSHLYNASVLIRLAAYPSGPLSSIYMIDWHPTPSWLGHLILAVLLTTFPPFLAERILVSVILVLFLTGAWMLAGARSEESRVYAFLAFPLAFHQSLQFGHYDFCIALGLYLVTIALWWQRRNDPGRDTITLIGGLLLLSYFSHPMPALVTMGSIAVLWLVASRNGRHLLAFIPAAAMLFWFFETQPYAGKRPSFAALVDFLTHAGFLMTFDERQLLFGAAVFVLFVFLTAMTFVRRASGGVAFGALLLVLLALYGSGVDERIALFLFIVPMAWFTPDLPRRLRTPLVALLSVIAIANVVFHTQRYRAADRAIKEIVRAFDTANSKSTFVAFMFDPRPPRSHFGLLTHAAGYAAVERDLVDLTTSEAEAGHSPIRYRPGYRKKFAAGADERADYIFVWKMPPGAKVNERYGVVREWGSGRLYGRR
jgi:hypothetical protein